MSSVELISPLAGRAVRRFAVAWRNRVQRSIHDVGVLDYDGRAYRFQYLAAVGDIPDFRPFIGFPDFGRVYESPRLWPFFDLRVMDRKRTDYAQYVGWLGLAPNADRLDVLARSGGEQKGDTVSVAEAPSVAPDGATATTFLARGSSYAVRSFDSAGAAESVRGGDTLGVLTDASNEANSEALLLTAGDAPVGWVPDLLIEYVRTVIESGGRPIVVQNNGPDAPWHMRLLVHVTGRIKPDWAAFARTPWPPLSAQRLP